MTVTHSVHTVEVRPVQDSLSRKRRGCPHRVWQKKDKERRKKKKEKKEKFMIFFSKKITSFIRKMYNLVM
jgi:hypothetical protein